MLQKARSDAHVVYQVLARAIAEQSLAPETRLPEALICRQLGVSRHAVRSAFQMLAADELITIRQNKGVTVATPSLERGKDILRIRIELEDIVVKSVVGKISKNDIERLRRSIQLEHEYVEKNHSAYKGQTSLFHRILAEMSGSEVLFKYVSTLVLQSSLVFYTYGRPRWTKCNSEEHSEFLKSLESGDVEASRKLMREHLEALYDRAFSDEKFRDKLSLEEMLDIYSRER